MFWVYMKASKACSEILGVFLLLFVLFFLIKKMQKEALKLECKIFLALWEKLLAQQSDEGSTHCGPSPPEPAQWHCLCPGNS